VKFESCFHNLPLILIKYFTYQRSHKFEIGSFPLLSILNERSGFKVDPSNYLYEVNVDMSFKILNNMKSGTLFDVSTLNPDRPQGIVQSAGDHAS
jgi:hypothetical protein